MEHRGDPFDGASVDAFKTHIAPRGARSAQFPRKRRESGEKKLEAAQAGNDLVVARGETGSYPSEEAEKTGIAREHQRDPTVFPVFVHCVEEFVHALLQKEKRFAALLVRLKMPPCSGEDLRVRDRALCAGEQAGVVPGT
jgi:hypothetical protein